MSTLKSNHKDQYRVACNQDMISFQRCPWSLVLGALREQRDALHCGDALEWQVDPSGIPPARLDLQAGVDAGLARELLLYLGHDRGGAALGSNHVLARKVCVE